jgi:hypothetical protein
MKRILSTLVFASLFVLVSSCATLTPAQREKIRQERIQRIIDANIDAMGNQEDKANELY